jgi:hypothetical protein
MTPNVAMLRFSDTTPLARPLLSISTARHLDAIEKFTGVRPSISSVVMSCRMHPDSAVTDPSPSARLDGAHVVTGEIVSQFFKDGMVDADYIVTYLVTFSDGSKEAFDAVISVRTFMGL